MIIYLTNLYFDIYNCLYLYNAMCSVYLHSVVTYGASKSERAPAIFIIYSLDILPNLIILLYTF